MDRTQFRALFTERILLLDGATGTQMMKQGMPSGVCPELWAMEHPDAITHVQQAYVAAGSTAVYTFTFGGSRFKLKEYGLAERTREINATMARLSRAAVGPDILVGGDLAPCGRMLLPYGDTAFEDVVEGFKEQVRGLLDGGVDFFAVETMMDLQEARAAILAVRELCDFPVLATMTFESGMRTLTGTDPVSAVVSLQALGADVVGTNCSTGPAEMVEVIRAMKPYARVPLVAKANAGKPRLMEGRTVFDMNAGAYAEFVDALVDAGVNGLGGCCGTDPGYISRLARKTAGMVPKPPASAQGVPVCAARSTISIGGASSPTRVGNRLNPTINPSLAEILEKSDMDEVFDLAREQVDEGAAVLEICAEVSGIDEAAVLREMAQTVAQATTLPVCICGSSAAAMEPAVRTFAGRCLVKPGEADAASPEAFLKLAEKYGSAICMPDSFPGGGTPGESGLHGVRLHFLQAAADAGLGDALIHSSSLVYATDA